MQLQYVTSLCKHELRRKGRIEQPSTPIAAVGDGVMRRGGKARQSSLQLDMFHNADPLVGIVRQHP
jgi:hypothetical protein